jgi:hypothetical protein
MKLSNRRKSSDISESLRNIGALLSGASAAAGGARRHVADATGFSLRALRPAILVRILRRSLRLTGEDRM